jgi:chromosomal replication initiator protein
MHQVKKIQFLDNNQALWDEVLNNLQAEYGEAIFKSWFSHLKLVECHPNEIILTVPSRFIKDWIQNNYKKSIEHYVCALNPTIKNIEITVKPIRAKIIPRNVGNDNEDKNHDELEKCDILAAPLDPRFTFDNFTVGDANKTAFGATKAIAEGKKELAGTNMLYIQSSVGMGKTHLLQALSSYVRSHSKRKKVAYLSADKFIHLYVKSIRSNNLVDFKEKLREADFLLVDDLQFICGKAGTQQELLNTVSAFTESNRKVIVTCDVSPYQLNLDKRAISKLAGGLVVNIKPSDYELRLDILKAKVQNFGLKVPLNVLELIAHHITSSNRELEGALNKLITHCSLEGIEANIKTAQEILKDNFDAHDIDLSVEQIVDAVAAKYQITVNELQSKSRAARFVLPRQIAMYLAKQLTSYSLQEIGFKIGDRDHATVIYSVKKLEDSLTRNKNLANEIAKLMEKLSKRG